MIAEIATSDWEHLSAFAQHGSHAAFEALVGRYSTLVYASCYRILADNHGAEDATQATFLVLFKTASHLKRDVNLGGWLHRTACQVALNMRTTQRRRTSREREAGTMQQLPASGDEAAWTELRPCLDEALEELPENQQRAIVLRFLCERSAAEIAAECRCSEDTVRTWLRRGLETLRAKLNRRGVGISLLMLTSCLQERVVEHSSPRLADAVCKACLGKTAPSAAALEASTKVLRSARTGIGLHSAALVFGTVVMLGLPLLWYASSRFQTFKAPASGRAASSAKAKGVFWLAVGEATGDAANWRRCSSDYALPTSGTAQTDAGNSAELLLTPWGRVVMGPSTLLHWDVEGADRATGRLMLTVLTGQLRAIPEAGGRGFEIIPPDERYPRIISEQEQITVTVISTFNESKNGEAKFMANDGKTLLLTGMCLAAFSMSYTGGKAIATESSPLKANADHIRFEPLPDGHVMKSLPIATSLGTFQWVRVKDSVKVEKDPFAEQPDSIPEPATWDDVVKQYAFSADQQAQLHPAYDHYTAAIKVFKEGWAKYDSSDNDSSKNLANALDDYRETHAEYEKLHRKLARQTSAGAGLPGDLSINAKHVGEKFLLSFEADNELLRECIKYLNENSEMLKQWTPNENYPLVSVSPELEECHVIVKLTDLSVEDMAQKLAEAANGKLKKQADGSLKIESKPAGGDKDF